MDKPLRSGLVWFRRDLRCDDHAALHHALTSCHQVHCAFILDRDILDDLPRQDRRVEFIVDSLVELDSDLRALSGKPGAGLIVRHDAAVPAIVKLAQELGVQSVFANHDYEPSAQQRDAKVLGALAAVGIAFHSYKDQVIFERDEVMTQAGRPYGVFTPYKNAWLRKVNAFFLSSYSIRRHAAALAERPEACRQPPPGLSQIDFEPTNLHSLHIPTGASGARQLWQEFESRLDHYHETRDFPGIKGPSYLGMHLRFGTVSIRRLARAAHARVEQGSGGASVWLSELIWRDFYFQILHHFPHAAERSFKPEYDRIHWEHGKQAQALFEAWCQGRTGYPLVDAAMAQINQTGYMHNRLRMVVASFLVKDLGIDWRWGERYFALHLNDFDQSANNGGWQWASSSGCDAQPYFRIFNPISQSERFDPEGKFIRRYLPVLAGLPTASLHAPWLATPIDLEAANVHLGQNYPLPIVDHAQAREHTLQRYSVVKKPA